VRGRLPLLLRDRRTRLLLSYARHRATRAVAACPFRRAPKQIVTSHDGAQQVAKVGASRVWGTYCRPMASNASEASMLRTKSANSLRRSHAPSRANEHNVSLADGCLYVTIGDRRRFLKSRPTRSSAAAAPPR
jgi:hypothetical protein